MRQDAKVDRSQSVIVAALRALGFAVQPIHQVGGGVPDLIVSDEWTMRLVELKCGGLPTPALPHEAREMLLTDDEKKWHKSWPARTALITNRLSEILETFGWPPDDIREGLDKIREDKSVHRALNDALRKYGHDPDIPASLA